MFRHFLAACCFSAACIALAADEPISSKLPQNTKKTSFHGFERYDFPFDGTNAIIVVPKKAAKGFPWIWRARFFGHQPQTDIALLKNGFHLVYVEVGGLYGAPKAVERWDKYYDFLTKKLNFSTKPVLEGMSRGGLIIFNWAKKNPGKVAAIYADAPVCDFNSWPGGKGSGTGSKSDYAACLKVYGLTPDQAKNYKNQPKDNLETLAKAGVPILAVCGATDTVVPMKENIDILAKNYRKAGGYIRVIAKPGNGHHPHSLKDPSVIVNFLKAASVGENEFIRPRAGLANAIRAFRNEKKGTVAFIGGSITEMNGYTKLTEQNLKKTFPECKFKFINAGISSTCSDTGAFRIGNDVFSKGKVDLLFVEFAVNDNQDGHLAPERSIRAMEGIVRQARKSNPDMDIVFLYTANESHLKNYGVNAKNIDAPNSSAFENSRKPGIVPREIAAHEKVAEHYGIPSVNFAADVEERMRHLEFDWKKFGGVHPAPFGGEIYGNDILALLVRESAQCDLKAKNTRSPMPRRLDASSFENGRLIPPREVVIKNGWTVGVPDWSKTEGSKRGNFLKCETVFAEKPGAELTLSFTGTAIGAYLTAGPDAGILEYKIDQSEWKKFDLFHSFSGGLHYPYTAVFADDLKPGKHTLTLKISSEKNPRSKGTAARIMAFAAN